MAPTRRGDPPRARRGGPPNPRGGIRRRGGVVSQYLLDTDHFSLYQAGHPRVVQQVLAHLTHRLTISVITVEESLGGWMRAVSQARDDQQRARASANLARDAESLSGWSIVPFTVAS